MQFSAMTMNMYLPDYADPQEDHRIINMTVAQSVWFAELGYNVWFTDHHFKGPWHSNTMQFAAYVLPQLPRERYIGFGVLSIPFYHPLRLVESMNLLDHFSEGRVLFGVGSGWQGTEPDGLGVDPEYHASGQAAEDSLDVIQRLWSFRDGDPEYTFSIGDYSGRIKRRVMPAPYTKPHPIIIRTASRESALIRAANMGWPAFLGIFGADLREQVRIYRTALVEAKHPPEVVANCLRWCSVDWLSVCVAETDEEANAREKVAQAEQMAVRQCHLAWSRWLAARTRPVARRENPRPANRSSRARTPREVSEHLGTGLPLRASRCRDVPLGDRKNLQELGRSRSHKPPAPALHRRVGRQVAADR